MRLLSSFLQSCRNPQSNTGVQEETRCEGIFPMAHRCWAFTVNRFLQFSRETAKILSLRSKLDTNGCRSPHDNNLISLIHVQNIVRWKNWTEDQHERKKCTNTNAFIVRQMTEKLKIWSKASANWKKISYLQENKHQHKPKRKKKATKHTSTRKTLQYL